MLQLWAATFPIDAKHCVLLMKLRTSRSPQAFADANKFFGTPGVVFS
jgi:hypothetical protein